MKLLAIAVTSLIATSASASIHYENGHPVGYNAQETAAFTQFMTNETDKTIAHLSGKQQYDLMQKWNSGQHLDSNNSREVEIARIHAQAYAAGHPDKLPLVALTPSQKPRLDAPEHYTSEPQAHLDAAQHIVSEPQAHLDGQHVGVEPDAHLDAQSHISPDHSTHLDSNATDAERQKAKDAAMVKHVQSQVKNGVDGKNGKDADVTLLRGEVLSQSHTAYASAISDSKAYTNQKFSQLKSEVDDNKKEASAGVSAAMAQANIPQVTDSQQFAIGAGVGGYDSENAIAVGASFHATKNTIVKMTVSDDTQNNFGYGAGVSVGW